MLPFSAGRVASSGIGAPPYVRHRPAMMGRVLGIVYRCIATHLIKKAGFSRKTARTGAVTLIQRFGSALNLNIHFHMLFIDGVYIEHPDGALLFHGAFAPKSKYRARVTPAKSCRGGRHATTADPQERTPAERRAAMTWAQRLKRVFWIGIETCPACGGAMRIIACIEDPVIIEKIFAHLDAIRDYCGTKRRFIFPIKLKRRDTSNSISLIKQYRKISTSRRFTQCSDR